MFSAFSRRVGALPISILTIIHKGMNTTFTKRKGRKDKAKTVSECLLYRLIIITCPIRTRQASNRGA